MEAFVTIGSVGLDLIHLVLVLAVIGLAVGLFVVRGQLEARAANARRDLEYAEDTADTLKAERDDLRQQLKTQSVVAEQARIDLAKAEARSEEDEKKFAELAQGVLRRANSQFLELADEHFKRHKEGAQTNLKELMTPITKNLEEGFMICCNCKVLATQDEMTGLLQ